MTKIETKSINETKKKPISPSVFDSSIVVMTQDEILNKLNSSKYLNEKRNTENAILTIKENLPQIVARVFSLYLNLIDDTLKGKDSFNFLFYETHAESPKFLKNLLNIFDEFSTNLKEFKIILKFLREITREKHEDIDKILYYIQKFVESGYITFENEELKTIIPKLSLKDSLSNWTKIVENSKIKNYDSLILENGDIYLALYEHELLAYWLSVNNIDISSCLRVHQAFDEGKKLFLSSLFPYPYHANSKADKCLYLSEEQARSLYLMFKKLGKGRAYYMGNNFETLICENSENLGANLKDKHMNLLDNLRILHDVAGADFDDIKLYKDLTWKFREYKLNLTSF